MIQTFQKFVRIIGDPEEPYILRELYNLAVADVTFTSLRILIGQNNLAVRTVVDQCLGAEYQSVLE